MPLQLSQNGSRTTRSFSERVTYHSKYLSSEELAYHSKFLRMADVPLEVSQKG